MVSELDIYQRSQGSDPCAEMNKKIKIVFSNDQARKVRQTPVYRSPTKGICADYLRK